MDERSISAKTGFGMLLVEKKDLKNIDHEFLKISLHNNTRVRVFQFDISNASNRTVVTDIICKNNTSQILLGMVSQDIKSNQSLFVTCAEYNRWSRPYSEMLTYRL
jgi:hypothetical protein